MSRPNSRLLVALLLTAVAGTACGGDDDDGDGGGSAAELESCKLVCNNMEAAACPISFPADICKMFCDAFASTSATCRQAVKMVSDCQLTLSDICSVQGCEAEEQAYQQACNM